MGWLGNGMLLSSNFCRGVQCWNISQTTSKCCRKYRTTLPCSEPTNEEQIRQIKQHVPSQHALPSFLTYLPPSLRFLHYLVVCLLRLGLFWQVIMKMFWVIETKARSSQSNNGTAAVATTTMRMTTTTVAFLSSAQLGGRSWAWHGRR